MTSMDDIMTTFTTEDPSSISPLSTTDEDYEYPDHLMCDRAPVREFRSHYEPPLFWMIALVGGAGNLAVVWIYLNFRRRLKTMTDVYLLLNLAVADLLFLVTLPLWAAEALHGWNFGSTLYHQGAELTGGAPPLQPAGVRGGMAAGSAAHHARELVFATTTEVDSHFNCRMVFPSHLGNHTKILVLSLQRHCRQAAQNPKLPEAQGHARVILAVVVVFIISQLPYNAVLVMGATQASNMTMTDCEEMKRFDKVEQVLKSLAYMHACLNPFLYVFVGVRFRRDMLQLLRCCRGQPTNKSK
ncbi:hypothetical protein L3Q82_021034, partial [Scortum barcoo]